MTSAYRFAGACLGAALLAACGNGFSSSTPTSAGPESTMQSIGSQRGSVRSETRKVGKLSETMTYLHSFAGCCSDGSAPYGPLVSVSGTLYGTTSSGGQGNNNGTVYSISGSGTYTLLHTFGGIPDGQNPYAGLIDLNGTLYGTTSSGGAYNYGSVFSISPSPSGTESVLDSFYSGSDGYYPFTTLINSGSTMYGTTSQGGVYNAGAVFSTTTAGAETVLHSFGGAGDGTDPVAPLLAVGSKLYGTTSRGGANGCGIVFVVSKSTGAETVLHSFSDQPDGCSPAYGTLTNLNGTLYGTTQYGGGGCNCGTVYSITLSGTETVLHSFSGQPDGAQPYGGLAAINGILYGTTVGGGVYNQGTVYSINTTTSSVGDTVIWAFGGSPGGAQPGADLINVNGTLYGTTTSGGTNNRGTVFSLVSI